MRTTVFASLLGVFSAGDAFASVIEAASNLQDGKIVVAVRSEGSLGRRDLFSLDLANGRSENMGEAPGNAREEIVGLFKVAGSTILLSQWTQEDGGPVHIYVRDLSRWEKPIEADCVSFDKVELKDKALHFICARTETKDSTHFEVPLTLGASGHIKQILPLKSESQGLYSFKLKGSTTAWSAIEYSVKEKWSTLEADALRVNASAPAPAPAAGTRK